MQIVFYFGLNAAVTALLGGKLLLQSRLYCLFRPNVKENIHFSVKKI